jgi:signal transduction histidine kinase
MEARLSPAKRREYLGDVLQAGRILLTHIDDILNFTRLDAGGFAVHPRPIDPRRAVAEAVRLMRAVARSHSIRLEADLARDLPPILVNLMSNAMKFSPDGGVVRLSVVQEADRLRLAVSDRGIGIPEDQLDEIFEPFHQVGDPAHARREGGTGLGLSIVKALVDRNRGTVSVESEIGVGTTISVWLPVAGAGVPVEGVEQGA